MIPIALFTVFTILGAIAFAMGTEPQQLKIKPKLRPLDFRRLIIIGNPISGIIKRNNHSQTNHNQTRNSKNYHQPQRKVQFINTDEINKNLTNY
jgi:hypothetical protein